MSTEYVRESEARTKWCPVVVFGVSGFRGDVAVSRHPETSSSGVDRCLGSGCMAWERAARGGDLGRCAMVNRGEKT